MIQVKALLKKIPLIAKLVSRFNAGRKGTVNFKGSSAYWQERYATGGNSGAGSYGRLALYKAEIINHFVTEKGVRSVIEFGCGDGNQLSLANYPSYIGFDVSHAALKRCGERFNTDSSKTFRYYACDGSPLGVKGEMTLSLDVIYHLVEDPIFEQYMRDLFTASTRYVIIYASDKEGEQRHHERMRNFTKWIDHHRTDWVLDKFIANPFPYDPKDELNTSQSDFFIYKKIID